MLSSVLQTRQSANKLLFAVQIYLKRSGCTLECCGQKDKNFSNNLYWTNYFLFEIHVHRLLLLVKGFSVFQQQGSEPEKQANKHTEAHQIALSCTDCHVWAFRLRFPWRAAFVKIDGCDAHHCQIPNMTDWQIKKCCPPRGNGKRSSPSARNANHLPKKCLVSDSAKQSPNVSLLCTWMLQIIDSGPLGWKGYRCIFVRLSVTVISEKTQ